MMSPRTHEQYSNRKHFPELDGLRALSVLAVITVHHHGGPWGWLGGAKGVTLFFILSGYLITMLALREEQRRGGLCLRAFYVRRTFRIFPPYYFTLFVYALVLLVFQIKPEKIRSFLAVLPYDLFYLQEIPFIRWGASGDAPFFHSWSLGIEEKFYLVWPVLTFSLLRTKRVWRLPVVAVLTVLFCSSVQWGGPMIGGCLFSYMHILLGCTLALALHEKAIYESILWLGSTPAVLATSTVFLGVQLVWPGLARWPFCGWIDVVHSVAAAVFVVSVLMSNGRVVRGLSARPLQFIGRLSYGIYLIHVLCLNAVEKVGRLFAVGRHAVASSVLEFAIAVVLSIAVAYGMHVLFERPLIGLGRRWSDRLLADSPPNPGCDAMLHQSLSHVDQAERG